MIIKGGHYNLRLKHYDYRSGWFFITNRTFLNRPYLNNSTLLLVKKKLSDLARQTNGIGLDYVVGMPDHIHAILIFENAALTLSEFWRRFKATTTLQAKRAKLVNTSLWQKNYYEHVIRNESALDSIREYIQANPYKKELPIREIYQDVKIKAQ